MNLDLVGQSVERVVFDYAVTLVTDEGAEVRIETEFSMHTLGGEVIGIDPERSDNAAEILSAILHKMITAATATENTGTLDLEFVNGARIEVVPSNAYEAWTFAAEPGLKVVCLPGGGLSTWGAGA